jgi:hypothetical protein
MELLRRKVIGASFEQIISPTTHTWRWVDNDIFIGRGFGLESISFRLIKIKERKHGTDKK